MKLRPLQEAHFRIATFITHFTTLEQNVTLVLDFNCPDETIALLGENPSQNCQSSSRM